MIMFPCVSRVKVEIQWNGFRFFKEPDKKSETVDEDLMSLLSLIPDMFLVLQVK